MRKLKIAMGWRGIVNVGVLFGQINGLVLGWKGVDWKDLLWMRVALDNGVGVVGAWMALEAFDK